MKVRKFLFCLLITAALVGCESFTKGKGVAEQAILDFHALYNQGNIDEIWNDAAPEFRTASNRQKYDDFMGAMQRKLGRVTSSSNSKWNIQTFNLKTTVSMVPKTEFENGQGMEAFIFTMDGPNAVLLGYNIQSMDLVTR